MEIVWVYARVGSNPTPSVGCMGWLVGMGVRADAAERRRRACECEAHPTPSVSEFGAWLSPVERCVRVAEVPGSNPGAPIGCSTELLEVVWEA